MNSLYLIRHGQAGTREAYDSLSELGQRQAQALGEYFVAQELEFTLAYAGTMNRQQQTVAAVNQAYRGAGLAFPSIVIDDHLNEFDLTDIYRELGPKLSEVDEQFRLEFEEMRREVKLFAGVSDAQVHRQWRPCDTKMVETWISGNFEYSGESWDQFRSRVISGIFAIGSQSRQANILVSTSATPTGVMVGLALGATDTIVRQLAGVLYNSSFSILKLRDGDLKLFQFNAVPHLSQPVLRTHR